MVTPRHQNCNLISVESAKPWDFTSDDMLLNTPKIVQLKLYITIGIVFLQNLTLLITTKK